jgi:hypothetical protein
VKAEPDACAGEVVSVEGLWDFDGAAVPDGFVGCFASGFDDRPAAVVEVDGFAVGEIAGVIAPLFGGEMVEGREALDYLLGFRRERLGDLCDLRGGLGVSGSADGRGEEGNGENEGFRGVMESGETGEGGHR